MQVLQSTCLRIASTAPWYNGNSEVYEDLGVPFFAETLDLCGIRPKVSCNGEPLRYAARQICTLAQG